MSPKDVNVFASSLIKKGLYLARRKRSVTKVTAVSSTYALLDQPSLKHSYVFQTFSKSSDCS